MNPNEIVSHAPFPFIRIPKYFYDYIPLFCPHMFVFFFKSKRVYIYIYTHIISAWYPSVHLFTLICVCFISLPAPKSENFLGVKNPIPRIIIPTYPLWAKHTWLYSNSWYPQIWLVIVELYLGIFEDIINHLTINMLSPDIYIYIYSAELVISIHVISLDISKYPQILKNCPLNVISHFVIYTRFFHTIYISPDMKLYAVSIRDVSMTL